MIKSQRRAADTDMRLAGVPVFYKCAGAQFGCNSINRFIMVAISLGEMLFDESNQVLMFKVAGSGHDHLLGAVIRPRVALDFFAGQGIYRLG